MEYFLNIKLIDLSQIFKPPLRFARDTTTLLILWNLLLYIAKDILAWYINHARLMILMFNIQRGYIHFDFGL